MTPISGMQYLIGLTLLTCSATAHDEVEGHGLRAHQFLEAYGLQDATPADVPVETLIDEHFVSARVGLFDICMPAYAVEDKRLAKDYINLVRAGLLTQRGWLEWMGTSALEGEALLADIKVIEKDFKRYKPDLLTQAAKTSNLDFFSTLQASGSAMEALARLNEAMGSGAPLGIKRADQSSRIVVFPNRKQFVEFISYVGWSDEAKQPFYWVEGTEVWTECFVGDARATCLEFPSVTPGDYAVGTRMNEKNPEEMEQQLTQIAAMSLFDSYYGARLPSAFVGGLANNLVIHVYGEVDTRLDGSVKAKETKARSIFIAGGNSDGGFLPKQSAENRWRENQGRDHFLRPLKKAQKSGKSENKDTKHKFKSFLLVSESESQRYAVTAPFFGTPAVGSPQPPDYVSTDYVEFLRAYKSAFLFWLQNQAEGKKHSPERFAEFLSGLAVGEPQDFEQAVAAFYGVPLSSEEVGKEDLEGRFLQFVAK